ncbi:MAG: CDP-diacylglycerol--glycerol-3-phosphate 3-phosphatidyltransferase [SAR324 cluster bacterium]|nr:CDP-diacylglycerol--glycerol-3-phosphate 3-phosphatidyltransferase [SAR324 cluster bacterium]
MAASLLKWITPNQLTLLRISVIPVLMFLIYAGDGVSNWVALGIFSVACVTDILDGELARFRGEVSRIGKLLDPLADKMLVSACLVMLVYVGVASVVPTILILLREYAVSGLRQVASSEGIIVSAMRGAKYKTFLQYLAVGFLIVRHESFTFPSVEIGEIMLWIATVWTLWTGLSYFLDYFRQN